MMWVNVLITERDQTEHLKHVTESGKINLDLHSVHKVYCTGGTLKG